MHVKDLLTEQEAADILEINPATLRVWLKKGMLPCYRIGGKKVRLARRDVERFLEDCRVEAGMEETPVAVPDR